LHLKEEEERAAFKSVAWAWEISPYYKQHFFRKIKIVEK
jgi:hypothetical protein